MTATPHTLFAADALLPTGWARDVLLHNRWPDWDGLGYVLLFSAPLLGLAMAILHRYERQYPKLIF